MTQCVFVCVRVFVVLPLTRLPDVATPSTATKKIVCTRTHKHPYTQNTHTNVYTYTHTCIMYTYTHTHMYMYLFDLFAGCFDTIHSHKKIANFDCQKFSKSVL